jgi:hypothetical protein
MLKFIIAFERADGMSREACHRYLRLSHGPLVAGVPEFARHVRRYVQNYALPELGALAGPGLVADGAAELWFDSPESFVRAYAEPRYLERIRPDESNFTNPSRYVAAFTRETIVWDGPATSIKMIRFLAVREGLGAAAARQAWSGDYATALAADGPARGRVARYVQSWSIPSTENPFPLARPFEGVDELWFRNVADVPVFLDGERRVLSALQRERPMDPDAGVAFIATESDMPGYGQGRLAGGG